MEDETVEYFDVDSENNWLVDGGDSVSHNGINPHSVSKGKSRNISY